MWNDRARNWPLPELLISPLLVIVHWLLDWLGLVKLKSFVSWKIIRRSVQIIHLVVRYILRISKYSMSICFSQNFFFFFFILQEKENPSTSRLRFYDFEIVFWFTRVIKIPKTTWLTFACVKKKGEEKTSNINSRSKPYFTTYLNDKQLRENNFLTAVRILV